MKQKKQKTKALKQETVTAMPIESKQPDEIITDDNSRGKVQNNDPDKQIPSEEQMKKMSC